MDGKNSVYEINFKDSDAFKYPINDLTTYIKQLFTNHFTFL